LVVSHQDLDHAGGALSLLQTVPVTVLWSSLPVESAIVTRAALRGTAWRCTAGQSWHWDGVTFTVLFPPITQYAAA
jgi:competence protein ComEC